MKRTVAFADGTEFPLIGLGVMAIPDRDVPAAMRAAVELGYRSFDTAAVYRNERGTGIGVRECGLPRQEVFVTTKLWNARQGYDEALHAFDESMTTLGLDVLDLYLIHWPVPTKGRYVDSWRALVRLKEEGRVRSIGVSNFLPEHLERIIGETGVAPALNQVELHPSYQQRELRKVHARHGIVTEAWSPLGRGAALADPQVVALAKRFGCSPAQLILAWLAQEGVVTIPKAASKQHMQENMQSLDITLDGETLSALAAFDRPDGRFGPDPATFETISR